MAKHNVFTLDYIKNKSYNYFDGYNAKPEVYDGVEYYCVGRNSSQNFYLGLREDGTAMKYIPGPAVDVYNEKGEWVGTKWERQFIELAPDEIPYLGHY